MSREKRLRAAVSRPNGARAAVALWGLLVVQAGCAAFFLADVVMDLMGVEMSLWRVDDNAFELVVVAALGFGVALTGMEIRTITRRNAWVEKQLDAASGSFVQLLESHFDRWSLTPSERDVALLAIKGLSLSEIAALRSTREGTVRAQCNAIYRKAGVTGRPQLLSVFMEELMGAALVSPSPDGTISAARK